MQSLLLPMRQRQASNFAAKNEVSEEGGTPAAELSRIQPRTIEPVAGPHGIILVLSVAFCFIIIRMTKSDTSAIRSGEHLA